MHETCVSVLLPSVSQILVIRKQFFSVTFGLFQSFFLEKKSSGRDKTWRDLYFKLRMFLNGVCLIILRILWTFHSLDQTFNLAKMKCYAAPSGLF